MRARVAAEHVSAHDERPGVTCGSGTAGWRRRPTACFSRSILVRPRDENRRPSPSSISRTYTRILSASAEDLQVSCHPRRSGLALQPQPVMYWLSWLDRSALRRLQVRLPTGARITAPMGTGFWPCRLGGVLRDRPFTREPHRRPVGRARLFALASRGSLSC